MELKKIIRIAMLISISIVLSIIESSIPLFNGVIPGIKLGLANVIVVIILYIYGFRDAIYATLLRVVVVGMFRTGVFSVNFLFSITGAILSVVMMNLFKKISKFSITGISIIGSISHIVGQIIIALIILKNTSILYYLPVLLICSVVTGLITGLASNYIIKNFKKYLKL